MTDFGGKLRQARERRGVSLRQIAASTKISVGALEALERNDISRLPGGIFSRAFVRSYAIEVGLDPDETVREFLERFQGESATAAAAARPRVTEEESGFESQQRMASVLLKLILISVVIAGVILYLTLRNRGGQRPAVATTGTPSAAAPAAEAPRPATQTGTPSPAAPSPAPAETPVVRPMRLEVHPTGPCWIAVTVDGRQVLSKLMDAGQLEAFEVRESAEIQVGDAGTFAFTVDGRPGRPLGESGQRRTARITRETLATYVR
jgi:cytoskeletal protein RodZ